MLHCSIIKPYNLIWGLHQISSPSFWFPGTFQPFTPAFYSRPPSVLSGSPLHFPKQVLLSSALTVICSPSCFQPFDNSSPCHPPMFWLHVTSQVMPASTEEYICKSETGGIILQQFSSWSWCCIGAIVAVRVFISICLPSELSELQETNWMLEKTLVFLVILRKSRNISINFPICMSLYIGLLHFLLKRLDLPFAMYKLSYRDIFLIWINEFSQ